MASVILFPRLELLAFCFGLASIVFIGFSLFEDTP
jgi:hypothetical protein